MKHLEHNVHVREALAQLRHRLLHVPRKVGGGGAPGRGHLSGRRNRLKGPRSARGSARSLSSAGGSEAHAGGPSAGNDES